MFSIFCCFLKLLGWFDGRRPETTFCQTLRTTVQLLHFFCEGADKSGSRVCSKGPSRSLEESRLILRAWRNSYTHGLISAHPPKIGHRLHRDTKASLSRETAKFISALKKRGGPQSGCRVLTPFLA